MTADLLESVQAEWNHRVVARTSMHDLLFTPLGRAPMEGGGPASAVGDLFEFKLLRGGLLVTADRCRRDNAKAVLRSFLMQLEGEGPSSPQNADL